MNRNKIFTVVLCTTVFVVVSTVWISVTAPKTEIHKNDPIFTREVVAYEFLSSEEMEDVTVRYEYLGELVPDKLVQNEVVELRTETSYTRLLEPATEEKPATYEGVFYTRPIFAKKGSDWSYIEHATTTETAFRAARYVKGLAGLFWKKAYADTISPFSGSGDGYIDAVDGLTWSSVQDAATGSNANTTNTTFDIYSSCTRTAESEDQFSIARGFYPFNTSTIPSSSNVTAATLNIFVTAKSDEDNDAQAYITVVETTQASETSLTTADFDQCGTIDNPSEGIESGERKDITSITTGAYLVFTFNATGFGFVARSGEASSCTATSGVTCIGVREGHDTSDTSYTCGPAGTTRFNLITTYTSEQTGTSNDPFLSVTYIAGASGFWQFQDY